MVSFIRDLNESRVVCTITMSEMEAASSILQKLVCAMITVEESEIKGLLLMGQGIAKHISTIRDAASKS